MVLSVSDNLLGRIAPVSNKSDISLANYSVEIVLQPMLILNFLRLLAVEDKEIENRATIGDKIVETLYSNRVTSENKKFPHPFPSPPFKVRVFVIFYRLREQRQNIAWSR